MSGFTITGAGAQPKAKPFELKEGTTLEEVQKYGTTKQKAAFFDFDKDYDGKLSKGEFGYLKSTNNDYITKIETDIKELEQKYKKHATTAKKLKSYGVEVDLSEFTIPLIKNVYSKTINGIKTLVIDAKNYTLSIPEKDAKGIELFRNDNCMDCFGGLNNATLSTKGDEEYSFYDSNVKINCKNGKKDYINDSGNSKLTITADEGDNYSLVHMVEFKLPSGTTTYDTRGDEIEEIRLTEDYTKSIAKITDKDGNVQYYSREGELLDIKNIENIGKERKKVTYNDGRVEYYSHDGRQLKAEYVKKNP